MRYVASSLLFAWFTIGISWPVEAASAAPGDTSQDKAASATSQVRQAEPEKEYGVLEETPNQRRIRLGQPIVASYPAPDYGELIETPNHRRQRLGLPPPEADAYGVTEETPNQRRQRLDGAVSFAK
jgi:hypothetical protein